MRSYYFLLSFLFLSSSTLCWSATESFQTVSVSDLPAFRPKTPAQVKTLENAMATVITICTQDLGLPPVEPLYVHLYADTNAYAAQTVPRWRLPEQLVRLTAMLPDQNRLQINMERIKGRPWGSLLRILAHEYAHIVELALTGGLRYPSHWIREGFGDWVAAKVMDSLGWESYISTLTRARQEVSRYRDLLPKLYDLETSKNWIDTVDQPKGRVMTYRLALLSVDKLIQKRGLPGMIAYFQSGDFQGSFGMSWTEFDTEVKGILKNLVEARPAVKKDAMVGKKPEWKIGDRWHYWVRAFGGRTAIRSEVSREETFDGVPSYVLRRDKNDYVYTKDALGLLASLRDGKVATKYNPPFLALSWPLEVGKEWKSTSVVESQEQKLPQKIEREVVVANTEQVDVPAGTFQAFKIEVYLSQTGDLLSEYWYSPQTRWFVKTRTYRSTGLVEEELVSFKID